MKRIERAKNPSWSRARKSPIHISHDSKKKLDHKFGPQYDRETVNCYNCCICQEKKIPSRYAKRGAHDALALIECNHQFHEVCLTMLIGENPTCPSCNIETSKYDTDAIHAKRAASVGQNDIDILNNIRNELRLIDAQEGYLGNTPAGEAVTYRIKKAGTYDS